MTTRRLSAFKPAPRRQAAQAPAAATLDRPAIPAQRAPETKADGAEVSQQAIAEAAYFLWQQRGGDDLRNWLDAEAALRLQTVKR